MRAAVRTAVVILALIAVRGGVVATAVVCEGTTALPGDDCATAVGCVRRRARSALPARAHRRTPWRVEGRGRAGGVVDAGGGGHSRRLDRGGFHPRACCGAAAITLAPVAVRDGVAAAADVHARTLVAAAVAVRASRHAVCDGVVAAVYVRVASLLQAAVVFRALTHA